MNKIQLIESFLADRYQKSDYPVLEWQFQMWAKTKPLEGVKVLDVTPLFANTLLKHRALIAAGAEITVGMSGFISCDPNVLRFVKDELKINVIDEPVGEFDVVADCAAVFCDVNAKCGFVELTRSGVEKYKALGKNTYVADSSIIKRIETEIGTGDSFFRAMKKLGYEDFNEKNIVIFGGGKVGKGIVFEAVKRNANITVVTDVNTADERLIRCVEKAEGKIVDYNNIGEVDKKIENAEYVVMATGVKNAFQNTASVNKAVCSNAIFANMGAEDEFGDQMPDQRVLLNKKTINFILEEPTKTIYIDATMALHNYGVWYIAKNQNVSGLIIPKPEIENMMLEVSSKNGIIADDIKNYL